MSTDTITCSQCEKYDAENQVCRLTGDKEQPTSAVCEDSPLFFKRKL